MCSLHLSFNHFSLFRMEVEYVQGFLSKPNATLSCYMVNSILKMRAWPHTKHENVLGNLPVYNCTASMTFMKTISKRKLSFILWTLFINLYDIFVSLTRVQITHIVWHFAPSKIRPYYHFLFAPTNDDQKSEEHNGFLFHFIWFSFFFIRCYQSVERNARATFEK